MSKIGVEIMRRRVLMLRVDRAVEGQGMKKMMRMILLTMMKMGVEAMEGRG